MKWADPSTPPPTLDVQPDAIPAPLKSGRQLVLWRWDWQADRGEWAKVPYRPNGRKASSTDPETWATWEEAWAAYQSGRYSGIGRVLNGQGVVCIDLDDCREGEGLNTWAASVLDRFETYSEWSPTGFGVHVWVAGVWPNKGQRNGKAEVYANERYMTLSGWRASRTETIAARPTELTLFHQERFAGKRVTQRPTDPDDDELLEQIRESVSGSTFTALFDRGDTSAYGDDESAADLALANVLVHWTDGDLERADRLFRRSALMRPKWDDKRGESTWGRQTLEKANADRNPTVGTRSVVGNQFEELPEEPPVRLPPPPPKFPLDALPRTLRTWALTIADWLQTPPEVPATFALAAISGAIGNTYRIAPRRTFKRSALVWSGVVAPPGVVKKTPSLEAATQPIHDHQQELYRQFRAERAQYEEELSEWTATPKPERGDKPVPPTFRHALVNDVTVEKLAQILDQTPRGLMLEHDELIGWVNAMNQYRGGAGSDRQHYLSIWGNHPIKVDRKSSPEPIYIRHPYVAITGGIQPAMIRHLPSHDGLFERVLWCWPTPPKMTLPTESEPSSAPILDYALLLHNLLHLEFQQGEEGPRPHLVGMTPRARELWDQLDQERHIDVINADPERASRVAKMDGQAASLTLILHLVRFQTGEWMQDDHYAEENSVQGGWDLASYYQAQAERIFELAGGSEVDELGNRILRWMDRRNLTHTTARDVRRATLPGLERNSLIEAALENLEDHGLGAVTKQRTKGGSRISFSRYQTTNNDASVGDDWDD